MGNGKGMGETKGTARKEGEERKGKERKGHCTCREVENKEGTRKACEAEVVALCFRKACFLSILCVSRGQEVEVDVLTPFFTPTERDTQGRACISRAV